ncbi:hypothetical protein E4T56_gene814 [Termitomyces sp. T112]|nr:hypothetical protein E4T56_gene814 [Termitomyces sp. T112]KAH0589173.1 hypothetical protein H2248_004939 [Termitomyces sp. 'cryptogamus']
MSWQDIIHIRNNLSIQMKMHLPKWPSRQTIPKTSSTPLGRFAISLSNSRMAGSSSTGSGWVKKLKRSAKKLQRKSKDIESFVNIVPGVFILDFL